MEQKKFDLDRFIEEIDDEAASAEEQFEEARYRDCPRCGSDAWDRLIYGKRGQVVCCNECEHDEEQ